MAWCRAAFCEAICSGHSRTLLLDSMRLGMAAVATSLPRRARRLPMQWPTRLFFEQQHRLTGLTGCSHGPQHRSV